MEITKSKVLFPIMVISLSLIFVNRKRISGLLDLAVLLYLLSSIISTFHSESPAGSFWGYWGCCGTWGHICAAALYLSFSGGYHRKAIPLRPVLFVWSLIYIWVILNLFGVNVFHLYDNPNIIAGESFASLGHTNTTATFFCMTLPFTAVCFSLAGKTCDKVLSGTGLFLGLLAAFGLCADVMWYGFLLVSVFIIPFLSSTKERFDSMQYLILIISCAMITFHFFSCREWIHTQESESLFLAEHYAGEILLLIFFILRIRLRRFPESPGFRKIFGHISFWTCLAVFIAVVGVSIHFATLDPHFGTSRGAVWTGSIWSYRLYSPFEKIFGMGNGGFFERLTVATNMLLDRTNSKIIYLTCHNSFLQVLLAQGILGMTAYVAGIVGFFRIGWRIRLDSRFKTAAPFFMAVIAYWGQSLVSPTYNLTVVLFFVFLGLFKGSLYNPDNKEDE